MSLKFPNFMYWSRVMELQLVCFKLVKAFRVADFHLYLEALVQLMPWMFALDLINYSRWLPVHIRDMQQLQAINPEVHQKFVEGSFVVHKTKKSFSSIALDQAHEQENATVKGEGGAVGLTENTSALNRWMIAGPELARMVHEFELSTTSSDGNLKHHEQAFSYQSSFRKDVLSLIDSFEDLGNPFMEEEEDLMAVDSKDVTGKETVEAITNIVKIGKEQFDSYVEQRLTKRSVAISAPLKKNNLSLFGSPKQEQSTHKTKIAELKNDCALFSRLYIACQSRDGDLDDFFKHENQPWPPSLGEKGELRKGVKADLVQCLEGYVNSLPSQNPDVEVLVIDGAVVVQMLKPGSAKTFQDYADTVFKPFILKRLQDVRRLDIVWDVYKEDSLKKGERDRRGKGARRKVTPSTPIPKNWQSFLRVDQNKEELFHLLSEQVIEIDDEKEIYSTYEESVYSNTSSNLSNLMPCTHEEADSRMMLHANDASLCGYRRIMIRTIDTDVLVLAISIYLTISVDELWVAFGVGKHFRYLPIHEIAEKLGCDKCKALPLFHSLTGCDTVSSMAGRGKKTAWAVWNSYPELTDVLVTLASSSTKSSDIDESLPVLERFVVLLYDKSSVLSEVNHLRKDLFARKSRSIDGIPPTQAALQQHIKRSVYQGALIWGQSLLKKPDVPSPEMWGWIRKDNTWRPLWTTLSQAKDSCYELIHCGCKKGCKGRCKCLKANLECTALCNCGGSCQNDV